jgi:hypothetical protein
MLLGALVTVTTIHSTGTGTLEPQGDTDCPFHAVH